MATRFYLPSTGAAPISPGYSSRWEDAGAANRKAMVKTRINSAMATVVSNSHPGATSNQDYAVAQYVYGPIAAQTITGTIKGRVRALESSTSANVRAYIVVRIVAPNGTERAELFFGPDSTLTGNPTSEFATALTSRRFPWNTNAGTLTGTLTDGTSQNGDYLVVEYGGRFHNASGSARTFSLSFGDDAGTDLAEDETTTAANNPWIEFSFDLVDYVPPTEKSGSDSVSAPADQTNALGTALAASDAAAAPADQASTLAVAVASSDSVAAALGDVPAVTVPVATNDAVAAAVDQANALATALGSADGVAVETSESAALSAGFAASDDVAAAVGQANALAVTLAAEDAAGAALDESAALATTIAAGDDVAAPLAQAGDVSVAGEEKSGSDAVAAPLDETSTIAVAVSSADAIAATLGDTPALAVALDSADAAAAATGEAPDVEHLDDTRAASDGIAASLTDAATLAVAIASADAIAAAIADAGAVAAAIAAVDDIAAALADAPALNAGIAGSDAIAASLTESPSLGGSGDEFKTSSDAIAANLGDTVILFRVPSDVVPSGGTTIVPAGPDVAASAATRMLDSVAAVRRIVPRSRGPVVSRVKGPTP